MQEKKKSMTIELNMNRLVLIISVSSLILTTFHVEAANPPHRQPLATKIDPAIKKICDATENPKVCVASISPFLNGKTDPTSVLVMQVNAGIRATERAILRAKRDLNQPSAKGGYVAECLKVCLQSYDSVMDSWKSALNSVRARKGFDVANDLTAVSSMVMSCEDAFTGGDPSVVNNSPLFEIDRLIMKMSSNGLNIQKMVFPGK
ncbi:hypothetical protein U1Q18_040857 [Sarracenia purpurea var. burkii]